MKPEYDVVIVGAGVAGCMTATTLGTHGKGLRTLLIDRNPRTEVGKKTPHGWICGDAVGEHHAKFVHDEVGITFGPPEIENQVNAVVVCSPDMKVSLPFEGAGYVLDRPKFARRLLSEATKTGTEYRDQTQALDLLTEGDFVTGVVCQDLYDKQARSYKVASKLVIDASGMSTKLRRNLKIPSFIERDIDRDDIEPTIRLIARLADGSKVETSRCEIYLDANKAPGGYLWMFPKASNKVNVGLGIQQKRTNKSLEALLSEWINATELFKGITPLSDDGNLPGAWPVSVRHQNDSLVANGFMIVGDAAWFANPLSAGGIGPSMTGGVIAGEVASAALQGGNVSETDLWAYNSQYVEKYGNKTAALEALRIYLQTLDNSELNYGLRNFVTDKEAVDYIWGEVPELSLGDKLHKVGLGLRKLSAFRNLVFTLSKMRALNQIYEEYPKTASGFEVWKRKVDSILGSVRGRFR
jgi:digeranylgeranylglycerophospholipid reductase